MKKGRHMKRYFCGMMAGLMMSAGGAHAGQLVTVTQGLKDPATVLKRKEHIIWWNRDRVRPVSVAFTGDMKESSFSTVNSRFLFTDGQTLSSNLIPPGGVAVISFENSGTYAYAIYGLEGDIHGKITVE